ncbi:inner membrane protein YpjD [uncultured Propionivibrio sp.]|uniref:cytochrome C assembly family protein n=1 Tax=uncultured Propionivibrio sp. TaxID=426737 RepID=UPI003748B53B
MPDILLHLAFPILASILYAGLGWHFWRTRWLRPAPDSKNTMMAAERFGIAAALLLQGLGLHDALFGAGGMRFSFGLALALMLWLAALIYWLESFRSRMDGLQPAVLPIAAICALFPVFFPQTRTIAHADAFGFKLHFLAAMLAYSLFTLSAAHAVFMSAVEKKLHQKPLSPILNSLPPLLRMETLLFQLIGAGFILLSVALGSGILFSETIFGQAMRIDHKTVFAFASWMVFAALLAGRHIYGWRGRMALRWTMTGFLFLLLAYVGSRFVIEVLLGRL